MGAAPLKENLNQVHVANLNIVVVDICPSHKDIGAAIKGSNGAANAVGILYSYRDSRSQTLQAAVRGECSGNIFLDWDRNGSVRFTADHDFDQRTAVLDLTTVLEGGSVGQIATLVSFRLSLKFLLSCPRRTSGVEGTVPPCI